MGEQGLFECSVVAPLEKTETALGLCRFLTPGAAVKYGTSECVRSAALEDRPNAGRRANRGRGLAPAYWG